MAIEKKTAVEAEKASTEFWLNPGFLNEAGEFISLKSAMDFKPMSGTSDYASTHNGILQALKELAEFMKPGETRVIKNLTVQIRRVGGEAQAQTSTGFKLDLL